MTKMSSVTLRNFDHMTTIKLTKCKICNIYLFYMTLHVKMLLPSMAIKQHTCVQLGIKRQQKVSKDTVPRKKAATID